MPRAADSLALKYGAGSRVLGPNLQCKPTLRRINATVLPP
jgi:hypothetical protein